MDFEYNARAAEALRLRRQGLTLQKIGDALGGVSRERARRMVARGVIQEIDGDRYGPHTEPELWRNRPLPQKSPA